MPFIANTRIEHGAGKSVVVIDPGRPVDEIITGADLDRLVRLGCVSEDVQSPGVKIGAIAAPPQLPEPKGADNGAK